MYEAVDFAEENSLSLSLSLSHARKLCMCDGQTAYGKLTSKLCTEPFSKNVYNIIYIFFYK